MNLQIRAIHQFHQGSAYGDGVTNGMLFTQGLLRELGFYSRIYVAHQAPELLELIYSFREFQDAGDTLLLVHHSMGHDLEPWLEGLVCLKILIYHNITPPWLLPPNSELGRYAEKGRLQLTWLQGLVLGAIADSAYNSSELQAIGYKRLHTLPLLFCSEDKLSASWDPLLVERYRSECTILFVGRIVENKCQLDLVETFKYFIKFSGLDARLVLAGPVTSESYRQQILLRAEEYGLSGKVILTGRLDDHELFSLYRAADLFVCLSEHEGFGIPLIEAQLFGLPVVAYDSSSVRDTLEGAGILVKSKQPTPVATLLSLLMKQPGLRRCIRTRQRVTAERFSKSRIKSGLADCLRSFGISVSIAEQKDETTVIPSYRFEGPFDSSYSLALVNREMALAMERRHPGQVVLHSTEGGGDFEPSPKFLAANPEVERLWLRCSVPHQAFVVSRLLYPPRVTAMPGALRMLTAYGWEESGFPWEYVQSFNRHLDGITVMSEYVRKVLIDSGVVVPIAVCGLGADHILNIDPLPCPVDLGAGFRFLHISSCFPRKGIDILLKAYFSAFSADDNVTLVIKTFPNPHNQAEQLLACLHKDHKNPPRVILINQDMPEGELRTLYQSCHCLVAPSRGEGFGLPLAEAMLHNMPVIVTGYGGQSDFCTDETAWLVEYDFAGARTHMGQFCSVWAEPRAEHLAKQMLEVCRLHHQVPEFLSAKTAKAKKMIMDEFRWDVCAKRFAAAVAAFTQEPVIEPPVQVGWIDFYGNLETSSPIPVRLDAAWIHTVDLTEFMSYSRGGCAREKTVSQHLFVYHMNSFMEHVASFGIQMVVLRSCSVEKDLAVLVATAEKLLSMNVGVVLLVQEAVETPYVSGLPDNPVLKCFDRILVQSVAWMNILKEAGIVENVMLIPCRQPSCHHPGLSDSGSCSLGERSDAWEEQFSEARFDMRFSLLLRALCRERRL